MSDQNQTEFYANAVNVTVSLYDVTLNFRADSPVSINPGEPPVLQATNISAVRMSPQHAKALAAVLIDQVTTYEERHNIILPMEDRLAEMWKKYIKEK